MASDEGKKVHFLPGVELSAIALLARLLEDAKAGDFDQVAVVTLSGDRFSTNWSRMSTKDMSFAATVLQAEALHMVTCPGHHEG